RPAVAQTSQNANSGQVQDEVESGGLAVAGVPDGHHEVLTKDTITLVARLVGEIELGRERRLIGRLHLDVDMARAAGVEAGDDRLQAKAAVGVGELVPAHLEAAVVVVTPVVGL